ncbi:MAG: YdcF family protein [Firmicutes bacterium]|nr:YdcF family protein [Bacillota bacterium]
MIENILDNIKGFGPVFAFVWILTIACSVIRPQRYFNSILLMISLVVTMIFAAGFFGPGAGYFLLACFLLLMLALLLVPVLLIANGVQMIKRESLSPAHILSLALGIFVGAGEVVAALYVLGISDYISVGGASRPMLFVFFTVFYFSFLVLSFVLYTVFIQFMPHRMDLDYIIVHGSGLAGGERLTKLLKSRVDKALEIFEKCGRRPVIIPSGGQGGDEKISEAQAMKDYLLSRGVPEDKIITEDRSSSTRENIWFSKELIERRGGSKRTALVSSNYHVYRCLRLAHEEGLKCTGIGAGVALYYWPSALIREFIALFLEKGFLIRALLGYLIFVGPLIYSFV